MEPRVHGYVERFARGGISGWAVDGQAPGRRLAVELVVDGVVMAIAPVNEARADLASLDAGRTDLGFSLKPPQRMVADGERVRVRVLGSQVLLPLTATAAIYEGVLERASDGFVTGWASHFGHPGERVVVTLTVDGCVIATVEADGTRDDLRVAGIGDGRHGFQWRAPADLRLEHVEVRAHAGPMRTPLHVMGGQRSAPMPSAPVISAPATPAMVAAPVTPPPAAVVAPPPATPSTLPPVRQPDPPAWMTPELIAALRSALPLSGDDDVI